MAYVLSLVIDGKSAMGTLYLDNANCGHLKWSLAPPNYFEPISKLLKMVGIKPESIRHVLVTADFLKLYLHQKLPQGRIGYVRYYAQSHLPEPLLSPSWLKKLVKTVTVNDHYPLTKALAELTTEPIEALALNPAVFVWPDFSQDEIHQTIREQLGSAIPLSIGTMFNRISYAERENLTLINTLLLHGVQQFYDSLHESTQRAGITAQIFTLKGNGMLITEAMARLLPIGTLGAVFANKLLAAAKLTPSGNMLFLAKSGDSLYIGLGENFLPKIPSSPTKDKQTEITLPHPVTKKIRLPQGQQESYFVQALKQALSDLNQPEEFLPVVLTGCNGILSMQIAHILQSLQMPFELLPLNADGAIFAPISFEQERYFVAKNQKERIIKSKQLWEELRNIAANSGFVPDESWTSYWEEKSIRYLPQSASLVRLGCYGPSIRQT